MAYEDRALEATTWEWKYVYPDFIKIVEANVLDEAACGCQKVGFCDRSPKSFKGCDRGYKDYIFNAVAICYDPCSPRESFKLM